MNAEHQQPPELRVADKPAAPGATSAPPVEDQPAQDADQLREDIEQTREQLGDTVEALAGKADVKVVGAASGHAGIVKASCVEGAGGARF